MSALGKKSTRAGLLIAALLTEPTIAAAAAKAGISEATAQRWLRDPEFRREYQRARAEVLSQTISRLLGATGEAVEALRKNLMCGDHAIENRAALGILTHAARGLEFLDFEARLRTLEEKVGQEKKL
jgi:hypothetical protein